MSNEDKRRAADGEDLPPTGAEARAQRRATSAPALWLVLGLILIAVFVMVIARGNGLFHAKASGPAPTHSAIAPGA